MTLWKLPTTKLDIVSKMLENDMLFYNKKIENKALYSCPEMLFRDETSGVEYQIFNFTYDDEKDIIYINGACKKWTKETSKKLKNGVKFLDKNNL